MAKTSKKHNSWVLYVMIIGITIAGMAVGYRLSASSASVVTDFYVAPPPAGDDRNPGTADKPWATIQKAANTLTAGQTVHIWQGTYRERVIPKNSGKPGKYITYTADDNDQVVIDGKGKYIPNFAGIFDISNRSYIKVAKLRVMNSGPGDNFGIMTKNSNHIIIQNNYTYNTVSSGISTWNCENVVIDGNEVELACNDGYNECISLSQTVDFQVVNNYIHDSGPGTNGGEGIDAKDGCQNGKIAYNRLLKIHRQGLYVDGWKNESCNIEVCYNTVGFCQFGIAVCSEEGGYVHDINIHHNVIYNCDAPGLVVADWGGNPGLVENIYYINNTIYRNGMNGRWGSGGAGDDWGVGMLFDSTVAKNIVVRNNIFSQNPSQIVIKKIPQSCVVDYNLLDGDSEEKGANYLAGDPLFVDPGVADFRLKPKSPAIDHGHPDGKYHDPDATRNDVGAFSLH